MNRLTAALLIAAAAVPFNVACQSPKMNGERAARASETLMWDLDMSRSDLAESMSVMSENPAIGDQFRQEAQQLDVRIAGASATVNALASDEWAAVDLDQLAADLEGIRNDTSELRSIALSLAPK